MSVRRALVESVVLSLQDACLFYPYCKGCLSRMDEERADTRRWKCFKCGYGCSRELVDYRYRLSMRVVRDGSIFGVTVFGTCLNQFFGIHASGLQRLVENFDGPVEASTRSALLLTAVKDCFIGRRFIFCIKGTDKENWPCLGQPVNDSCSKNTVQVIASQMILPKAPGLEGYTVVSFYQALLQKAVEHELGSSPRPPATTLRLSARHSPASSFNDGTLCSLGLSPQSLLRSQDQDCTLSHTPPWQQSLGLVTSSAEQEDGSSTQEFRDETSGETDGTPRRAQIHNHKVTEASMLPSPLPSSESRSCGHSPTAKYPHSTFEKEVGNIAVFNTCLSRSHPGHNCSKMKRFSTTDLTETVLPSSLVWEDLPFSESLTAFLCEENKDVDNLSGTELHRNVQNEMETGGNNLEIRSANKHPSIQSTSVCQSNAQLTDSHSQALMGISSTTALNGGGNLDLSEQVYQHPAGSVNQSQARNQEDEGGGWMSKDRLEGDVFDCSEDLFSDSVGIDVTDTIDTRDGAIGTATEACPVRSKPDKRPLRSEKAEVKHATPDKQKRNIKKCTKRHSLIPSDTPDIDFIPPSQSTPIVKVAVVSGSPDSSYSEFSSPPGRQDSSALRRKLPELDTKRQGKATCSFNKLNYLGASQLYQCDPQPAREKKMCTASSGHGGRFTPKRRFWKPNKHRNHMTTRQPLRVQREALISASTGQIKCNSSECEVTVCDYEDSEEVLVPPTPGAKACQSVKLRRRSQTDAGSGCLGCKGQQRDEVHCKRTLMGQKALTGSCDRATVDDGSLDGSDVCLFDCEKEAGDWSRDLFSDSV